MNNNSLIIALFAATLLMFSCSENAYFEQSIEIANGIWKYQDSVTFEIEISDTVSYFDLILDVDHNFDYSYENIYVIITTTFPSGEKIADQVSLQLADNLDQWEGKCNSKQCKVSILLQNRVFFQEEGLHTISLEQYNRVDPLEGINGLSLRMIKLD